jgi:LPXTG-motif cell wall-anchored protein
MLLIDPPMLAAVGGLLLGIAALIRAIRRRR